jgi:hypothetical protein
MGFVLFLALNCILLIRPEELYPPLEGARLYLQLFALCLLVSLRDLLVNVSLGCLWREPITCCLVLYGLVFCLSNVVTVGFAMTLDQGIEFAKLFLYYFLLTAVVSTPERLRAFLRTIVVVTLVMSALILLNEYEVVTLPALEPIWQNEYDETETIIDTYPRLVGTGIFHDPNDLSLILGAAAILATYLVFSTPGLLKFFWLACVPPLGWTLVLTQSRGGMLGILGGAAAFFASKLGWKKALPIAVAVLGGALMALGGRQANFSLEEGTGQARLKHWSDGLILMTNPQYVLTGIGYGKYEDEIHHVAHNSYVHAFVETGMAGGILFSGMFALGFAGLFLCRSKDFSARAPGMAQLQPYMTAVLTSYMIGMGSLSRNYVPTTFMMLGLATVYLRMAWQVGCGQWYRMSGRIVGLIVLLGLSVFALLKIFLMMFVRFN